MKRLNSVEWAEIESKEQKTKERRSEDKRKSVLGCFNECANERFSGSGEFRLVRASQFLFIVWKSLVLCTKRKKKEKPKVKEVYITEEKHL